MFGFMLMATRVVAVIASWGALFGSSLLMGSWTLSETGSQRALGNGFGFVGHAVEVFTSIPKHVARIVKNISVHDGQEALIGVVEEDEITASDVLSAAASQNKGHGRRQGGIFSKLFIHGRKECKTNARPTTFATATTLPSAAKAERHTTLRYAFTTTNGEGDRVPLVLEQVVTQGDLSAPKLHNVTENDDDSSDDDDGVPSVKTAEVRDAENPGALVVFLQKETNLGRAASATPFGYLRILPGDRPELHVLTSQGLALLDDGAGAAAAADNTTVIEAMVCAEADFLAPELSPLLAPVPEDFREERLATEVSGVMFRKRSDDGDRAAATEGQLSVLEHHAWGSTHLPDTGEFTITFRGTVAGAAGAGTPPSEARISTIDGITMGSPPDSRKLGEHCQRQQLVRTADLPMDCVWLDFAPAADRVLASGVSGGSTTASVTFRSREKDEWLHARVEQTSANDAKFRPRVCVGADGDVFDPAAKKVLWTLFAAEDHIEACRLLPVDSFLDRCHLYRSCPTTTEPLRSWAGPILREAVSSRLSTWPSDGAGDLVASGQLSEPVTIAAAFRLRQRFILEHLLAGLGDAPALDPDTTSSPGAEGPDPALASKSPNRLEATDASVFEGDLSTRPSSADVAGSTSEARLVSGDTMSSLPEVPSSSTDAKNLTPEVPPPLIDTEKSIPEVQLMLGDTVSSTPDIRGTSIHIEDSTPEDKPSWIDTEGSTPEVTQPFIDTAGLMPEVRLSSTNTDDSTPQANLMLGDTAGSTPEVRASLIDMKVSKPEVRPFSMDTTGSLPEGIPPLFDTAGSTPEVRSSLIDTEDSFPAKQDKPASTWHIDESPAVTQILCVVGFICGCLALLRRRQTLAWFWRRQDVGRAPARLKSLSMQALRAASSILIRRCRRAHTLFIHRSPWSVMAWKIDVTPVRAIRQLCGYFALLGRRRISAWLGWGWSFSESWISYTSLSVALDVINEATRILGPRPFWRRQPAGDRPIELRTCHVRTLVLLLLVIGCAARVVWKKWRQVAAWLRQTWSACEALLGQSSTESTRCLGRVVSASETMVTAAGAGAVASPAVATAAVAPAVPAASPEPAPAAVATAPARSTLHYNAVSSLFFPALSKANVIVLAEKVILWPEVTWVVESIERGQFTANTFPWLMRGFASPEATRILKERRTRYCGPRPSLPLSPLYEAPTHSGRGVGITRFLEKFAEKCRAGDSFFLYFVSMRGPSARAITGRLVEAPGDPAARAARRLRAILFAESSEQAGRPAVDEDGINGANARVLSVSDWVGIHGECITSGIYAWVYGGQEGQRKV